jgi:hypothetical protein
VPLPRWYRLLAWVCGSPLRCHSEPTYRYCVGQRVQVGTDPAAIGCIVALAWITRDLLGPYAMYEVAWEHGPGRAWVAEPDIEVRDQEHES